MEGSWAATAGHVLVVGEWVSQEDEDEDNAEGGECWASDVKETGRLGVFNSTIQVIEELLVPNLERKKKMGMCQISS